MRPTSIGVLIVLFSVSFGYCQDSAKDDTSSNDLGHAVFIWPHENVDVGQYEAVHKLPPLRLLPLLRQSVQDVRGIKLRVVGARRDKLVVTATKKRHRVFSQIIDAISKRKTFSVKRRAANGKTHLVLLRENVAAHYSKNATLDAPADSIAFDDFGLDDDPSGDLFPGGGLGDSDPLRVADGSSQLPDAAPDDALDGSQLRDPIAEAFEQSLDGLQGEEVELEEHNDVGLGGVEKEHELPAAQKHNPADENQGQEEDIDVPEFLRRDAERQFEKRQQMQRQQIKEMRARLNRIEGQMEMQNERRDEIIERYVQRMLELKRVPSTGVSRSGDIVDRNRRAAETSLFANDADSKKDKPQGDSLLQIEVEQAALELTRAKASASRIIALRSRNAASKQESLNAEFAVKAAQLKLRKAEVMLKKSLSEPSQYQVLDALEQFPKYAALSEQIDEYKDYIEQMAAQLSPKSPQLQQYRAEVERLEKARARLGQELRPRVIERIKTSGRR